MNNEPTIIFQDDALLIINKPAGITVNRSDTTKDELTVQDFAEKQLGVSKENVISSIARDLHGISPASNAVRNDTVDTLDTFLSRAGIVHRLDKETSGVLIIAKTPESFVELQRQFKEREVKKTYIALAHGMLSGEGEIRVPVGRLPWNRKRFGVIAGGRDSVTRYRTINNLQLTINNKKEDFSLLELFPETGRTHQIRVHLKHINHPIFSDTLYAGRKTARDDRKILPRVFLHAAKISFTHPVSGERIEFEAPLPDELVRILPINK